MELINEYIKGDKLYGNDFSISEIQKWFEEEEEAYAGLKKGESYKYEYHAMNRYYGYQFIDNIKFENALGIGSAYGHEFLPILSQIKNITILEPSDDLKSDKLGELRPNYAKPNIDGSIDFPDNSFDLITCFGVLHHIPNVSYVLSEMIRVLNTDGFLLLREPIRTMGDWRYPRQGLTKNERGIPPSFFDDVFKESKVEIVKKSICDANFAFKILNKLFTLNRDTIGYQKLDKIISNLFSWNIHYHPTSMIQKMGPSAVFYIIKKV